MLSLMGKKGNWEVAVMKKGIPYFLMVMAICLLFLGAPAKAARVSKPIVLTPVITDVTSEIRVLGYRGTTLEIKNGSKTVKRAVYSSDGVKTIRIKMQKAGAKLQFRLKKGNKKSSAVSMKVKKFASQNYSSSVKKPSVQTKTLRSDTTSVKVKAAAGTTLKIVNDRKKVVKSVSYKKTAVKTIKISKQTQSSQLYFYCVKGKHRSAVVKKKVKDVTAPKRPSVTETSSGKLLIKGEIGSTIYIKYGSKSSYVSKGVITSSKGKTVTGLKPDKSGYYSVKLRDGGKNFSAVKKIKSKDAKAETPSGQKSYTYAVRPLLSPFNEYFYVQTDDPDPSDLRFVDKESVYYTSGQEPACLVPSKDRFLDVSYENEASLRVNGGYIFCLEGSNLDGGSLVLQRKNGSVYRDTDITVSCAPVKSYVQYLVDTFTSPSKSFFENMDAVQSGLQSLALYPRSTMDSSKKNSQFPYPLLAVSPYPELSLNEWYLMYEYAEQPMLLNQLYPYILDSLGFPSVLASAAELLDSSCTYTWGDYHYLVDITQNGETKTYGGAGNGNSSPVYSNRIQKLFLFNGTAADYAADATLKKLFDKEKEYGDMADSDAASYEDLIKGDTFTAKIGVGSWIRVGTEGWDLSSKSYAYVTQGCRYDNAQDAIPYSVEEVWVDGRYINQYNKFEQGATFSQHPQADIMIRDMTYTNKWGELCRGDVTYEYDASSGCWLSRAYVSYSSNVWSSDYSVDTLPDNMILTPQEVSQLQVDQNTNTIPSGLIYDGSAFPGTSY